jgi:hypothetical protein
MSTARLLALGRVVGLVSGLKAVADDRDNGWKIESCKRAFSEMSGLVYTEKKRRND